MAASGQFSVAIDIAGTPLGRVRPEDVQRWVAELISHGGSRSRVRQAHQLLSAMFKAAVASGYLARTPCLGVKLPKVVRREAQFLDHDEVIRLAEAIKAPFGTLVLVLAYGGLRWGEAAALRLGRCDLLRGRLNIAESLSEARGKFAFVEPKTYEARTVVLPAFVRDRLGEHIALTGVTGSTGLVFRSAEGDLLRGSNFRRRVWAPALAAAGLPPYLRIHDYADVRVMPTSARNPLQGHVIALRSSA
jgi:integrase